jgi:hypothetical protein
MTTRCFALRLFPETFAVCRFGPNDAVPPWVEGVFVSVTRTASELSVVCPDDAVPAQITAERGWRCLQLEGEFAFDEVGVMATLTTQLADARVSILALSTHDTDYVFVPGSKVERAIAALRNGGHRVDALSASARVLVSDSDR